MIYSDNVDWALIPPEEVFHSRVLTPVDDGYYEAIEEDMAQVSYEQNNRIAELAPEQEPRELPKWIADRAYLTRPKAYF